ncbi:uncharacterized protein LOC112505815 [Cynara cardunculus var. scolymus]|uniref:uncharacterized protein LOC112505815 n=1 Tax=Cynara cardunculus var. scolymus TaxID=59895 RepID=UPI000D62E6B1|nr:uncharacterized protein LOC112505815 [Cynara cardunculus var. scolymus]
MGCGMSKSNLMDEAFNKRTAAPKLLIKNTPQPSSSSSIVDKPPELQKINTTANNGGGGKNSDVDSSWFGSPSFREYIKSSPRATTGNEQGEKETVIGEQGGQKLTCNDGVCELRHSRGDTEHEDKKETIAGRFRKAFQVQQSTFWHNRPWHIGHPKATKKTT